MKIINGKKNNWLLYAGIAGIIVGIILDFAIGSDEVYNGSRLELFDSNSIPILLFTGVIAAPFFEELIFRSFFTNKKWLIGIGCAGLALISIFSPLKVPLLVLCLASFILLIITYKKPSKWIGMLLIFTITLNFALGHYQLSDFKSLSTSYPIINQFSLGLIMVWITQNFGLLKSMFFHGTWNGLLFSLLIVSVQFPDTTKEVYEDSEVVITWNRAPRFDGNTSCTILYDQNKMVFTNTSLLDIYESTKLNLLSQTDESKKSNLDQKSDLALCQTEPLMRYNFEIKVKNKKELDAQSIKAIKSFLVKKELAFFTKKKTG